MADPIRLSGMSSGLDTEAIVEAMLTTYQTKIDNQNKKLTKLQWQQEAYQDIISKMTSFQNKYFDVLNKDTYLAGASTFNKLKTDITSAGGSTSGIKVSTTSNSAEGTYKVSVSQLATSSAVKGNSIAREDYGLDLGKAFDSVGYTDTVNDDGTTTRSYDFSLKMQVGGVTKTINFAAEALVGADGSVDSDALKSSLVDNLNEKLQAGFGYSGRTGAAATGVIDADNGQEWFVQAQLDADGNIKFVEGGNASITVTENVGSFGMSEAAESAALSLTSVATGENAVSISVGGVTKNVKYNGVSSTYYDTKDKEGNEAILEEYNQLKEAAYRKANNLADDAEINETALKNYKFTSADAAKAKNSAALTEAINDAFAAEGYTFSLDGSKLTASDGNGAVAFDIQSTAGGTLGITKSSSTNTITAKTKLEDIGIEANGADGGYTMTINGVEISVGADATINSLITAVNSSEAGVKMSYSSLTNSFSVEAKEQGGAGNVMIEGNDFTKTIGLTDDSGDMVNFTLGTNAVINVNGKEVYLNENSYTVDGTTISFDESIEVGETYTIELSKSSDGVKDAIKSFVEDYNQLIDDVYEYIGSKPKTDSKGNYYEPLTDAEREEMSDDEIEDWEEMAKVGALYNDSTVSNIMSKLRTMMYSSVTLEDGSKIGLYNIGIKASSDFADHGKLEFDEERFDKMYSENADAVTALFTDPEQGIMKKLDGVLDSAVKASGANKGSLVRKAGVENTTSAIDSTIFKEMERIQDRIATLQDRYDAREEYWWSVFTNMESMISELNSQSTAFSNFSM